MEPLALDSYGQLLAGVKRRIPGNVYEASPHLCLGRARSSKLP